MRKTSVLLALLLAAVAAVTGAQASEAAADAVTAHALDYTTAKLRPKLHNTGITFQWVGEGDRFWYRKYVGPSRVEFTLVESSTGQQSALFDADAMAAALGKAGSKDTAASMIRGLTVAADGHSVVVRMKKNGAACRWPQLSSCEMDETLYQCDLPVSACKAQPGRGDDQLLSPDGRTVAFVRDHNLFVKDAAGGAERQLTKEGVEGFAYGELLIQYDTFATENRRAGLPDPLKGIAWSPDGKYLLALRQDLRSIPLRLTSTEYLPPEGGTPIVHMARQMITADKETPNAALDIIEIGSGTTHRSDIDPKMYSYQTLSKGSIWWTDDNSKVWLVAVDRGNRVNQLVAVDLKDGHSKVSIVEKAAYNLKRSADSANGGVAVPNIAVLSTGKEALWYSERDGWGHVYLYDTATGAVKRQVTKGPWLVVDILRIDEKARTILFTADGREPGQNPYYRHIYRVSLDGGEPVLLTPENADHDAVKPPRNGEGAPGSTISPNGRYLVDAYSTIAQPDKAVLRTIDGKVTADIVDGDASELTALGIKPPEPFVVKAADGTTDLYGVLFKPRNFDASKKYPVIEVSYPADNTRYVPTMFRETIRQNFYAFAESGAIVVWVDGRQTGMRSLKFRTAFDADWGDQRGAVDHVAALRNLAASHAYMDLDRVGLTGYSTGGYASLRATLLYPDFYKVTVSGGNVSDYLTTSGAPAAEFRYGVPTTPEVLEHYKLALNEPIVGHLKGKLLMMVAGVDEQAHFQQSMSLFKALQDAMIPYDTLVIPDSPHSGGGEPYAVYRTVKYFVDNLVKPE